LLGGEVPAGVHARRSRALIDWIALVVQMTVLISRLGFARLGRSWSWLDGHLQLLAQPCKLPAGCGWVCVLAHVLLPLELPQ